MLAPADLMRRAGGLVPVWLNVAPEHEEEFNAWYAFEHLGDMVALDGFLSARRYRSDWLWPKYLALYETVDESAETGPAFTRMIENPTRWSQRVRGFYGSRGYRTWRAGENLLWASPEIDADRAVQMWLDSPAHRRILLTREWREIGLSAVHIAPGRRVYAGMDVTIVTADFGARIR